MKVRCLFLLLLPALSASAETYKIDAGHSQIAFTIHQFVSTVRGDFHRFSGMIEVDREHPERSSVIARISVGSIDTKIKKRDQHLLSSEFFDAGKFPEIVFQRRYHWRLHHAWRHQTHDAASEIGNPGKWRFASRKYSLDRHHRSN